MRALKLLSTVLLAAIAVTAGLFVAAVVALVGVVIFLVGKLLGNSRVRVTTSTFRRPARSPVAKTRGDAIDVTATEVADDSPRPLTAGSRESERVSA